MKSLLETVISDYEINTKFHLRTWQRQAMKTLERHISDRPISVLVDATCGSGKSTVQHLAKPLLPEKFPDVIVIDSWTLFKALGKGAVPNKSFWEASLELMKQ